MTIIRNDHRGAPKSYTQLAAEFPNSKGYAMMADRERVMGVHAHQQTAPPGAPSGKPRGAHDYQT